MKVVLQSQDCHGFGASSAFLSPDNRQCVRVWVDNNVNSDLKKD